MSFASEVKKEILTITENKKEQIAFTFGALQGLSTIILSSSGVKLQIKSPILNIIKKILPILKEQFDLKTQIGFADELIIKNKRRYYYLEITEHALEVIEFYKEKYEIELKDKKVYEKDQTIKKANTAEQIDKKIKQLI